MNATEKQQPIDRVINRLTATYGAAWERQNGNVPLADCKTVWLHELSGFLQSRDSMMAIAWALENLPERCPNVIEFRNLCRQAPAPEVPRLPEPAPDPDRIAQELAKLGPLRVAPPRSVDSREWARRLIDRHDSGEHRSTPVMLNMALSALGMGV